MGSGDMFRCRRGLPLAELFSHNVILNLRHLTDEMSCRWLAQFLLQWKFQEAENKPATDRLETLIVIDDASRFVSAGSWPFDKSSGPTPLTHVLSVLRSSGMGLCVVTQLPGGHGSRRPGPFKPDPRCGRRPWTGAPPSPGRDDRPRSTAARRPRQTCHARGRRFLRPRRRLSGTGSWPCAITSMASAR